MPVPFVSARPDRLGHLRTTAGGIADGLRQREGQLDRAVDRYRARTEPAFQAECGRTDEALAAFAASIAFLGEWVGQVGDAFAEAGGLGGIHLLTEELLFAALPSHLVPGGEFGVADGLPALDPGRVAGAGLGLATALATNPHPQQLAALSRLVGPDRQAGRWLSRGAASPAAHDAARYVAVLGALTIGIDEAGHRWRSEPDRHWAERSARAAFDGAVAAGATYGGGAAGQELGTAVCSPIVGPVAAAAVCGPVAAAQAAPAARRAGEALTDLLLGDEPEPWEREPDDVAAQIVEVDEELLAEVQPFLDEAAELGAVAADRHADFVMDHPWLWDDAFADAPVVANPNPVPDPVPVAGAR
jgi:hypothetical protein